MKSLSPVRIFFILLIWGFLIYSNTFWSSFVFDDMAMIVRNPSIRHLLDLPTLWHAFNTRFIVGLSLALNYFLGAENVFGYHLFNTLVHVFNSFWVYGLVVLTLNTPKLKDRFKDPSVPAFLTALLFLCHPIQTQAVTYIWQRATSLAAFFYLGALVCYIRARLGNNSFKYFNLCIAMTVLGMLTKEIVFTLPLAVLLYEGMFLGGIGFETKTRTVVWGILLGTMLIIPGTMVQADARTLGLVRPNNIYFKSSDPHETLIQKWSRMSRTESAQKMPRHEFLLTQINVLRTYLRLFLLPVGQNTDYDYPRARSIFEPATFLSFLLLAGFLGWGIYLRKRYPLPAFGIFWFFLNLAIESTVAQENFIFEHRLYLPMTGLSVFFVVGGFEFFKNNPRRWTILLCLLAACYSFLTYQRNFVWKDEITLWEDAVKKSPHKARPYNNRGYAYQKIGQWDRAMADYHKAIELRPDYADAYSNRGGLYGMKGLLEQALPDLDKTIALNPQHALAYSNRGAAYFQLDRLQEALSDFNKALEWNPDVAEFYSNRGAVYNKMGFPDRALEDLNIAIAFKPDYAIAYDNRAKAYLAKKEYDKARQDLAKAKSLGLAAK